MAQQKLARILKIFGIVRKPKCSHDYPEYNPEKDEFVVGLICRKCGHTQRVGNTPEDEIEKLMADAWKNFINEGTY